MNRRSCLIFCLLISFCSEAQQTNDKSFEQIEILVKKYDDVGNYSQALIEAKNGLTLAKTSKNLDREGYYHLRLAKFHYNLGNSKASLMHFRLYAILREQEVSNLKNTEMVLLENAYLEQLAFLSEEIVLNDRLIDRIQVENETYEESLRWIYTSAKIGAVALVVIFVILYYDRKGKKNQNSSDTANENTELERLRSLAEKQQEEQERNQTELQLLKGNQQRQAWYTRQLQNSILPKPNESLLNNGFFLQFSKGSTNGDFFTIQKIENKLVIAVVDCPGHGPDAVFNTVTASRHLQKILQGGVSTPSMVLTMMDQKIKHSLESTGLDKNEIHGSRMAVCEINLDTKEVEYAGAGFPLFTVHHDKVLVEKGNQFPVGDSIFSDAYYSSTHHRLSDGDMIYLITDGYYRQLGGSKNKKFMRSALVSLLQSMHQQPIAEQKFIFEKVLMEWKGKNPLTDDVLVVGLKM